MFERLMELLDLIPEAKTAEERKKLWAEYDRLFDLRYPNKSLKNQQLTRA